MEDTNKCKQCLKKTLRTAEEKRKLTNRLSRIEGQIRGIRGMIERDAYCTDILSQASAVSAAVNSFGKELLECHIRNCVVRDIEAGNEEVIDDLVETIRRMMK